MKTARQLQLERIKSFTNKNNIAISTTVGLASGVGYGVYGAMTATKVIVGPTAVAGAISTQTMLINGVTYVFSTVKAGLLSKICIGLIGGALVGFLVFSCTSFAIDYLTNNKNK